MGKTLTQFEFISRVSSVNHKIKVIGQYKDSKTKVLVLCNSCNHKWYIWPTNIKKGCPECAKSHTKQRKTHEKFIIEVKERFDSITVISTYETAHTKMLFYCNKCHNEFISTPNNLFHLKDCPKCRLKPKKITYKIDALTKLSLKFNNIKVISAYKGTKIPIKLQCTTCNHEWKSNLSLVLKSSYGCPKCAIKYRTDKRRKTKEMLQKQLNNIMIDEYYNDSTPIQCKCTKCNHRWQATPNNLVRGRGCPNCKSSNGEKSIYNYLKNNQISFQTQYKFKDCKYRRCLSFDFVLFNNSDIMAVIEYDGIQHYECIDYFGGIDKYRIIQTRDKIKDDFCEKHKIPLLRIKYTDKKNIDMILDRFIAA